MATKILTDINITTYEPNGENPARTTIGGVDALGRRIDTITVATDKAAVAARKLLKPALDAVEAQADAALQEYQSALDSLKQAATDAHRSYAKRLRNIFSDAVGSAEASTGPVTVSEVASPT